LIVFDRQTSAGEKNFLREDVIKIFQTIVAAGTIGFSVKYFTDTLTKVAREIATISKADSQTEVAAPKKKE
jgi:hypothetical protein